MNKNKGMMIALNNIFDKNIKVLNMAQKVPDSFLNLPIYRDDDGGGHVEVNKIRGFNYITTERGETLKIKKYLNMHNVLYLIFDSITYSMASNYELINRESCFNKDTRQAMFERQEYLMGLLDNSWKERLKEYHLDILKTYPYDM